MTGSTRYGKPSADLALEAELRSSRQLNRTVQRSLFGRHATLADLATSIDHDHLGAVIRSVGYRSGSVPEQTPAFAAVELSMQRTFGRWQVQPLDTSSRTRCGPVLSPGRSSGEPASTLRKVQRPPRLSGRVAFTFATARSPPSRPAMETAPPPQSSRPATRGRPSTTCFRPRAARRTRRRLRSLSPAAAPTITHQEAAGAHVHCIHEKVALNEAGVPTVSYLRQLADNGLRTTHDFNADAPPDPRMEWPGAASRAGCAGPR